MREYRNTKNIKMKIMQKCEEYNKEENTDAKDIEIQGIWNRRG